MVVFVSEMACTTPQTFYKADRELNGGKAGLTKNAKKAVLDVSGRPIFLTVSCGKCKDCRLQRSYEWSLRIMHEVKSSGLDASFITLTYDDANLPEDYGLHYRDFQLFMHKLRKRVPGAGRFFMSGEYGDQFGRPHFHAILFSCSFPDKVLIRRDPDPLYTSDILSGLWSKGFASIGDVTLSSAGYVARYAMKKISGPSSGDAYQWLSPDGEVFDRELPFCHMSLKPGIGYEWFQRYHCDVFPADHLVFDGRRFPVPRYYTKLWEAMQAAPGLMGATPKFQRVMRLRKQKAVDMKDHPDNQPRRLRDRWEHGELMAKAKSRKDL